MTIKVFIQLLVFALVLTLFKMPQSWGERSVRRSPGRGVGVDSASIKHGSAYIEPNARCCQVVRKVDMVCVRRIITSEEEEKVLNPRHVYYVSRDCNKPVPVGDKCRSKCKCQFLFRFVNIFFTLLLFIPSNK
ncbi:hypothetical protein BAE44_0008422 [Dichanthelium oligosanthes]|uniref:Bifunctional inhibitor/plant lipid transfer protein/seed storage helical domain-containing protein n=1 Tax=Dichanthelium oligosanthes TaxID=888268 RepID=A0A1E5VZM5_9POAL|nr:hypothetical protein BAE44_0008422 [Dichanthelium oligosanthes]